MKPFFRHAAAMITVNLTLITAACSSGASTALPGGPGDTFEPLLAPTASPEKAVIMVPQFYRAQDSGDIVKRLNQLLADRNVNVEFVLESDSNPGNDSGSYNQKVKSEFLSGKPSADAYLVYSQNAESICQSAPVMDVSLLLPTAAPAYSAMHKELFEKPFVGLPVGVNSYSYRVQPALMLRDDVENQCKPSIGTLNDMLAFADAQIAEPGRKWSIAADPLMMVELWAYEQGYYPLGSVYSDGYFFAGVGDTECKPELLERISGFYDFMERLIGLYTGNVLFHPADPKPNRETVGLVRNLGDYYQPDPNNVYAWIEGSFTAHEFYRGLPSFYLEGTYSNGTLLIPEGSGKAVNVLNFVEWLYLNRENYDVVAYGEPGVDYDVRNGRLVQLSEGQHAAGRGSGSKNTIFMTWPGAQFFGCSDYSILPECAPGNIEELIDNGLGEQIRLPFEDLLERATDESRALLTPTDDMRAVMNNRNTMLNYIVYGMYYPNYQSSEKSLEGLKNDWLLGEYANMIDKFKASVEAQK